MDGWRFNIFGEWRDEERRAGMTGLQKMVEIVKNKA